MVARGKGLEVCCAPPAPAVPNHALRPSGHKCETSETTCAREEEDGWGGQGAFGSEPDGWAVPASGRSGPGPPGAQRGQDPSALRAPRWPGRENHAGRGPEGSSGGPRADYIPEEGWKPPGRGRCPRGADAAARRSRPRAPRRLRFPPLSADSSASCAPPRICLSGAADLGVGKGEAPGLVTGTGAVTQASRPRAPRSRREPK